MTSSECGRRACRSWNNAPRACRAPAGCCARQAVAFVEAGQAATLVARELVVREREASHAWSGVRTLSATRPATWAACADFALSRARVECILLWRGKLVAVGRRHFSRKPTGSCHGPVFTGFVNTTPLPRGLYSASFTASVGASPIRPSNRTQPFCCRSRESGAPDAT